MTPVTLNQSLSDRIAMLLREEHRIRRERALLGDALTATRLGTPADIVRARLRAQGVEA